MSMRYLRIFLLYAQDTLTEKSRAFIWLLLPVVNGGFFLIFWYAALQHGQATVGGWNSQQFIRYYLLLMIVGVLFNSHIEDLLERDIKSGEIVKYLLKPLSFYWSLCFIELPYRLIQGAMAIFFLCGYCLLFSGNSASAS